MAEVTSAKVHPAPGQGDTMAPPHANGGEAGTTKKRSVADEWESGPFSIATFSWLFPLITLGYSRPLTEEDIGDITTRDEVAQYLTTFEANLKRGKESTIYRTIWRSFDDHEYYAVLCKLVSDCFSYVPPICINLIVRHTEDPDRWGDIIFLAAGGMLLAPLVIGLCNHWFYHLVMIDGLHARTAIQAVVYAKLLRISSARTAKDGGGAADTILNLQSTDCRAIEMCYWMWMYLWAVPLQLLVTTVFLYFQVGWPVFVGIAMLFVLIPIENHLKGRLMGLTKAASESSDERIKLVTEIIHGMQVVKLQVWETMFSGRVEAARAAELKHRRNIALLQGANTALTECAGPLAVLATFAAHALLTDRALTAATAFTTLSLMGLLYIPIKILPMLMGMVAGGSVAAKRLATFLYSDELAPYVDAGPASLDAKGRATGNAVEVRNAVFGWELPEEEGDKEGGADSDTAEGAADKPADTVTAFTPPDPSQRFCLTVDEFALQPGSMCVVAGRVGCGKSSFLCAVLGQMRLLNQHPHSSHSGSGTEGSVSLRGSVAYCAQQPWIQNSSVRDNILFGRPFDEDRYQQVLAACALEADLAALPAGDQTEIGERGINLSGGQKARVSLGRACYSDADVVVLDDILSAVDAHVARTITDRCLVDLLKRRGKAVLIATHQSLCYPASDAMVILEEGKVVFTGSFQEAQHDSVIASILSIGAKELGGDGEGAVVDAASAGGTAADAGASSGGGGSGDPSSNGHSESAPDGREGDGEPPSEGKEKDAAAADEGRLIADESTEQGAVSVRVYYEYMQMGGVGMAAAIICLAVALNTQQKLFDWWMSRWAKGESGDDDDDEGEGLGYYLGVYAALVGGACVLIVLYRVVVAYGGLGAAARIHRRMFVALLNAPLSFFDTTPSGRLLNRFTADMKAIDETLPTTLSDALSLLCLMVSVLVSLVSVVPMVLVPLAPLWAFYGWIQLVYRNTARELKRFDSTTQSPVFNHFQETVNGLATIRAFRAEPRMLQEAQARIDYNSRFWTKNNFLNRWLGLRLDWIGAGLVGSTALTLTLAIRLGWQVDAGLAGFVLYTATTLTGLLNWGVRRFSEAEMAMVAVERAIQLFHCPQERTGAPLEAAQIPATWPDKGELRFEGVCARYRPGLPLVLDAVSLHVPAGAKVGVCGRTGSGKTSLAKCLFRLMELEARPGATAGGIFLDGLDIARVPLPVLRAHVTMIPQDPTLFAGPLRYSLDPFEQYTDAQLWTALSAVDMEKHIKSMEGGMDARVDEGGSNLSAGQRQLLCMARALLESPKVICMDEATSNIDSKTDDRIQNMLQEEFRECTVLTIAHRIDTIMWYDRILVLAKGRVVEYDTPRALGQREGSAFSALLDEYRKGKSSDTS